MSVQPLGHLSTNIWVWSIVLLVSRTILYGIATHGLKGGIEMLKVQLEVVTCRAREGTKPITVSTWEVYLAYGIAAFYPALVIVTWTGFVNMTIQITQASDRGYSLLDSVTRGEGVGIASMVVWLIVLVIAFELTYRTLTVVRIVFFDPQFGQLVFEHVGVRCCGLNERKKKAASKSKDVSARLDSGLPLVAISSSK